MGTPSSSHADACRDAIPWCLRAGKTQNAPVIIECEVLAGLKPFAAGEVRRALGRLSAPGRDSAALRRLRAALARRSGLADDPEDGELLLRIRRARGAAGWDLLTRLPP
jgi:hypothetical protein